MNTLNTAAHEAATHLAKYANLARAAHNGTSFSPEKRGEQLIIEFEALLQSDLEQIQEAPEDVREQYVERFKKFFGAWLSAKSRIMSPMITGPARFPVQRMEKYRNWEQGAYEKFNEFRGKAIKGILKSLQPEKTFMSELERYTNELEGMKANHEKMKVANKRIKDSLKNGTDISEWLMTEMGIKPHMIEWTLQWGFGLSNNLANIKRVEERIKILTAKQSNADNIGEQVRQFDGYQVIFNHEADRLQIKHESKPDADTITNLKKHGFKWSPRFGSWQRQLNSNGVSAAERVLNIKLR